jgi:tetratricopeptide (TPR) repeat protein
VKYLRPLVLTLALACSGCIPPAAPAITPRLSPEQVATRLAEADRLASRGCYLCLKEAAAAYAALLAEADDAAVAARSLENNLMLALRERELRMPDSGALALARRLQQRITVSYQPYFTALDAVTNAGASSFSPANRERAELERQEQVKVLAELEAAAPTSAMKAYFYISLASQLRMFKDLKPSFDAVVAAQTSDLSIKYRMLAFPQTYNGEAARELIGMETGFGEVHLLIGQRGVMGGNLPTAFRELSRARELLPDSLTIVSALANVTFSYARYADALALFDAIVAAAARPADPEAGAYSPADGMAPIAQLGRAKSLSYLKRHEEAIAVLDELLTSDARNNPGEKYYWRAWNRLQLAQSQLAYDDAMSGLNAMRNDAIYRLAGIAAFSLGRNAEARDFFENALQMNPADCDSARYLGLLDAAEQKWQPATGRFTAAASCYQVLIGRMQEELAQYEKDITGLSNSLIAGKRAEIKEAEALHAQSAQNAAAATKNAREGSRR